MSWRPFRRWFNARAGILAGVICSAPVCAARAQPAAVVPQAWAFTWSITPTANERPVNGGAVILDVAIWRGSVRISVREGPMRLLTGDGGTLLLKATDSTLAVVKPARREVLTASASDLGALMGGPGNGIPLGISDVSSVTRIRGDGARAFGYRTRRVELAQRYTLTVSTPTMRRTIQTQQTHDIDISRDIARLDPGFGIFADHFARSLGLPGAVRARLRAVERSVPDGVPVRATIAAVTVSGSDTLRTATRVEMTALRREAVDTTTFVIPVGYRITEMSRLQQQRKP